MCESALHITIDVACWRCLGAAVIQKTLENLNDDNICKTKGSKVLISRMRLSFTYSRYRRVCDISVPNICYFKCPSYESPSTWHLPPLKKNAGPHVDDSVYTVRNLTRSKSPIIQRGGHTFNL